MSDLATLAWPSSRLTEAVEALARRAGLSQATGPSTAALACEREPEPEEFERRLGVACDRLNIEMEAVDATGGELADLLRNAGPALLRYVRAGQPSILLLLTTSRRSVSLLSPALIVRRIPLDTVRDALCADAAQPVIAEVDTLLNDTRVASEHRPAVKRLLVKERLATQRFAGCWTLRVPPAARLRTQLRMARLPARLIAMLAAFLALYVCEIGGWALIGRGALGGRIDPGWLLAWALLLLGAASLRLLGAWMQGMLAIDIGVILKQRLVAGALGMNMHDVRQQGAGHLLSRVIESEALESFALSGGFGALIALAELLLAMWVLALGAGGVGHVVLLASCLAIAAAIGWRYYARLRDWTRARLDLTRDLIERMVGHRTRVIQKAPERIHDGEDERLERYTHTSRELDRAFVPLGAGLSRGWLIVGLVGLVPAFLRDGADAAGMAIALGGILLAARALTGIATGLGALLRAVVAWREIAPLLSAARHDDAPDARDPESSAPASPQTGSPLVRARDLAFRHSEHGAHVLDGCDLTIERGDRLLLEGSSGGGKSTLASLLVGLRQQESGLLLLDGFDRATLGRAWRRISTAAPQFHENHVLSGSLAFNLLMGRRWPATPADLAAAEALCRELGLGDLIDRMPSGLMQTVGETGWQLSHGERSRMYLARALLQEAELVVLDESFASLDPATLDRCLRCALARAPTLMVIAHP